MGNELPPDQYEEVHVHSVYAEIAQHFSETRYKPWPIIARYLQSRPAGSIGADVGCGNGKNLNLNPNVFMVGSDRSGSLVSIASKRSKASNTLRDQAIVGDILDLPHPLKSFDFAICIAVIHHLANHERRVKAIEAVLSLLKSSSQDQDLESNATALFYVWALEQKSSRRGWDENSSQDVMVPWTLRGETKAKSEPGAEKVFQRYYHLYRKGELEESIQEAGGDVVDSGYEKDNWWAIARNISE